MALRSRQALSSGALEPVRTELDAIDEAGVRFAVHRVATQAVQRVAAAMERPGNPFLPPDPALVVGDVSKTHVAVLNKFPVRAGHFLLVTRAFVHQETLLDATDFAALATALAEVEALAFYNAGPAAGASQTHRHLQAIPLPLVPDFATSLPIAPLLEGAPAFGRVEALPFAHAFARIEPDADASRRLDAYHALLAAAGTHVVARDLGACASQPYNLLATREWMLVVPRSQGRFGRVSVNALGFAGSFFARDREDEETLRTAGPLAALRGVSRSIASLPA